MGSNPIPASMKTEEFFNVCPLCSSELVKTYDVGCDEDCSCPNKHFTFGISSRRLSGPAWRINVRDRDGFLIAHSDNFIHSSLEQGVGFIKTIAEFWFWGR